jgi:hypothetical protein
MRRSALRRREDVVEAWLALVVWVVVVVGGVVAGIVTGSATDAALERQRTEHRPVAAVLTRDARWNSAVTGQDGEHVRAPIRWTGPDGAVHTGYTLVDPGHRAGDHVTVWEDDRTGALSRPPPGGTAAALQSVLMGGGATVAFSGLGYAAGRGLRFGLDRRRAALWEKEWAAVEPRWHRMR